MIKNDRLHHVWNAVLMLCILPFLLLAFYTYPSIHDDYLDANSILRVGAVNYIKNNYIHWTGRYTELTLKSVFNPLLYTDYALAGHLLSVVVLVLVFCSIYAICHVIVGKRNAVQLSLLIMTVFSCGLTDMGAFFYWYSGSTAYTFGVIFSVFFIVFLYRLRQSNSFVDFLACALFVVMACGSYEVVMISILWMTTTNLIYSRIHKKGLAYSAVLCGISIVSALLSVLAPGNSARISGISPDAADMSVFRILLSAFKSVFFVAESMMSWLNSIFLLLGVVLLLQSLCKTGQIQRLRTDINPLLICVWLLLGLSASVLPSVIAYQAVWAHTWQCVYFFFLLGWLVVCNAVFHYFNARYNVQVFLLNFRIVWFTRISFVLIAFLSNSSNVHIAYWDLLYVSEYKQRSDARIATMKRAATEKKIAELQPLFSSSEKYLVPQTLYTVEYNDADAQAFAAYYGVDSVVVNRCHLQ